MEHLIDRVDRLRDGLVEQRKIGLPIDDQFLTRLTSITREAEWFVQHTCEQLQRIRAETVWKPCLSNLGNNVISLVTSNYDRAIEIGARAAGLTLDDGFQEAPHVEAALWRDFDENAQASLMKVHGSTDWYQTSNGAPIKLRHPIPLLGDFRLCDSGSGHETLSAALVLPSREKRITTPPYPSILAAFHHHARKADIAVFVGTSLRDPHLRSLFDECARRIPTALVSPGATPDVNASVTHIRQTASYFLVSTLPRLMATGTRFASLMIAERDLECNESVVDALIDSRNKACSERERCAAIESLLKIGCSTHPDDIRLLLADDSSAVRLFALGLVPTVTHDGELLLELAKSIAVERADPELTDETKLLEALMRQIAAG